MLVSGALYEGWLEKQNRNGLFGFRGWNSRFFVLLSNRLVYKKGPADRAERGAIPLSSITALQLVDDDDASAAPAAGRFDIVTAARTFELKARTYPLALEWVSALYLALQAEGRQVFDAAAAQHAQLAAAVLATQRVGSVGRSAPTPQPSQASADVSAGAADPKAPHSALWFIDPARDADFVGEHFSSVAAPDDAAVDADAGQRRRSLLDGLGPSAGAASAVQAPHPAPFAVDPRLAAAADTGPAAAKHRKKPSSVQLAAPPLTVDVPAADSQPSTGGLLRHRAC